MKMNLLGRDKDISFKPMAWHSNANQITKRSMSALTRLYKYMFYGKQYE